MAETPQAPATRAWVKWLLALSLALNLAVIGLIAGMAWRLAGPDGPGFRPPPLPGAVYTRALDPRDRRALMGDMRRALNGDRPDRAALRGQYRRMIAALRAEPFDPEAVRALIAAQSAVARARLDLGQRLLADHLAAMTPAERARFAARLEEEIARAATMRRDGARGGHWRDR